MFYVIFVFETFKSMGHMVQCYIYTLVYINSICAIDCNKHYS